MPNPYLQGLLLNLSYNGVPHTQSNLAIASVRHIASVILRRDVHRTNSAARLDDIFIIQPYIDPSICANANPSGGSSSSNAPFILSQT
jgi:hypothetical protein